MPIASNSVAVLSDRKSAVTGIFCSTRHFAISLPTPRLAPAKNMWDGSVMLIFFGVDFLGLILLRLVYHADLGNSDHYTALYGICELDFFSTNRTGAKSEGKRELLCGDRTYFSFF
jgi:hypothetical protein